MNIANLEDVYDKILIESLELIKAKKVNISELVLELGISNEMLDGLFEKKEEDFTLYLKLYDTLVEW